MRRVIERFRAAPLGLSEKRRKTSPGRWPGLKSCCRFAAKMLPDMEELTNRKRMEIQASMKNKTPTRLALQGGIILWKIITYRFV